MENNQITNQCRVSIDHTTDELRAPPYNNLGTSIIQNSAKLNQASNQLKKKQMLKDKVFPQLSQI